MWDLRELTECACAALREEDARSVHEQSPYGVDALDELALQAVLRTGLAALPCGVLAEQRYPAHSGRKRRSEGDRCDIVLTPEPGQALIDPLMEGTLFAGRGVPSDEAMWIEVKVARQFSLASGVAGPDGSYAGQLLTRATADARRLATAPGITHGALLTIQFTASEEIAEHDLTAWLHRCLDLALPVASPIVRGNRIVDRIGNAWMSIATTPVRPSYQADG